MKIKVDYSDGRYSLYAVNGREVDLPRWVVWAFQIAKKLTWWLDRHYITPADNAAWEKEHER